MKKLLLGCAVAATALTLFCDLPTSSTAGTPPVNTPGNGTTAGSVPFSLGKASALLHPGKCYIGRISTTSNYAYWVLPVVYSGTADVPFVKISGIKYRDASGAVILAPAFDFSYVQGRVLKLTSSSIFTTTSLAAGDTGYIFGIDTVYARLASITADSISFSTSASTRPLANVIQTGVTVSATQVDIAVRNTGTLAATLNSSYALLLDAAGLPLIWTFVTPVAKILPVNTNGTFSDSSLRYPGTYSSAKVIPDYEDGTTALARRKAPAGGLTPDVLKAMLDERNTAEALKAGQ